MDKSNVLVCARVSALRGVKEGCDVVNEKAGVVVKTMPRTGIEPSDALPTELSRRPRTLRIPTDDDDIDEVLFIDDHREVASMRNRISTIQYQVNWKFQRPDGLDKDWFDEKDLSGCQEAVAMYQRWRQAGAHFLTNTGLAPTLAEFRAMDPLWLEIGNNSDKSCLAAAIRIVATNLNVSNFELSEEVISGFKEAHGVPQDAGIPPSKMHDFLKLAYTHGFHYNDAIFSRQLLKQSVGDPIRDICRAILDEPDGEFLVVSVTDSTSHCWVLAKRYKRCIDRSLCMIQDNENVYPLGQMPRVSFIRHIRRVSLQTPKKSKSQRRSESRKRKAKLISNSA
ncbi:hypothetical protein AC1031_016288 [Aphanomyces cochlioides]|nr:hypothetical protein AC1031_016288 [Aphanomyces cochlioides]